MLFRRVKVITILLMVFMMSIGCSRRKEVSIEPKKETKTTAEKSSSKETIYVYVCGEVKHPGVYRFSKGERIVSAVKAADSQGRTALLFRHQEVIAQRLAFAADQPGTADQLKAALGRDHAAAGALKDLKTDLGFQLLDGAAQARLRNIQILCRLRKGTRIRQLDDLLQLL